MKGNSQSGVVTKLSYISASLAEAFNAENISGLKVAVLVETGRNLHIKSLRGTRPKK